MAIEIRSIAADELPAFAGLMGDGADEFASQVESFWASGASGAELCFVAEEHGRLVGRVGYRRSADREYALFGLWLPWGRHVEVGRPLLGESLEHVRDEHAEVVETWINPSFHSFAREREEALAGAGFECVQSKVRLVGRTATSSGSTLDFRTRADVGRALFVDAIARVTEGTLDRLDALERERLGAQRHAEIYVEGLEGEGDEPDRWLLAYDGGRIAGFVILTGWDDDTGTLAYIGVLPDFRGRGIVDGLVGEARRRLAGAGLSKMLADVDDVNRPMLAALERVGMRREGELRVYWARLEHMSH